MFKKIFWVLLIFLMFIGKIEGAELSSFQISPIYLFTDDDVGVKFAVTVLSQGSEIPKNISLMEVDEEKEKIKYRWPLNDDGTQGDVKAGDGVYSRNIQFKEKRPKKIVFYVLEEQESSQGKVSESLPSVSSAQRSVLEIRAHPTMIDILKDVWNKVLAKFN